MTERYWVCARCGRRSPLSRPACACGEPRLTPAGIAGGQGRTARERKEAVENAGLVAVGLVILAAIAAAINLIGGCL